MKAGVFVWILSITRFITIVAFQTSIGGVAVWMAISASCASMIGTISITTAGMIKGRIPIIGGVALGAVCSELAGVDGWFSVTGNTIGRKALVHTARMTLRALNAGMCAGQRKSR
jgi:hypothetical protein